MAAEEVSEVGATAEPAAEQSMAGRLGLKPGQFVQEFGYDDDVDDDLRLAIETLTGNELADEDSQDVVDAVLYWWRDDDGDLVDSLVDGLTNLAARAGVDAVALVECLLDSLFEGCQIRLGHEMLHYALVRGRQ